MDGLVQAFSESFDILKKKIVWLHQVLIAAHGIFSCNMWDLVPQPGIKPRPLALGVCRLRHWTTREVSIKL